MNFEEEFSHSLFKNAIIFIDSAIGFINKGVDNYDNMIQAVVNLQFAMELALKSSVVSYRGIRTILINKQCNMTDLEIEQLFTKNNLKIREYDDIKNYTKGQEQLYNFERKEYAYMKKFQDYRNYVLHSLYIFSDQEKKNIEKDIIYTLVHIFGVLMRDETSNEDRTFMQEYLNSNEYSALLKNPIYIKEFYHFLKQEYEDLYMCPYCSTRTMASDHKCARCFNIFSDRHFFEFVHCGYCGEDMVICDAANSDNMIRGLCLNCEEDTTVYKCLQCGSFVNVELFDETNCHEGFCRIFDNE